MPSRTSSPAVVLIALLVVVCAGVGLAWMSQGSRPDALVVYCAHDSVYSEQILRDFERRTGVPLSIRFDTEATKSLGLVHLLIAEKEHPRCDVFWNNQVLGTMQLHQAGVLHPYRGAGHRRIPAEFKDPQGNWTGFAGRLRVYVVNTERMPATPAAIAERMEGDLSRMAVAKPLYGTTLSHYALLWQFWGGERLQAWHRELRQRGAREVAGNATVMNLVAEGTLDFGWTDTDDVFVALDAGKPVDMLPILVEDRPVLIPNSVAIIRGTKKLQAAQMLVEFLLSGETELALAESKARQIPLGEIDDSLLPVEVLTLREWSHNAHDLTGLGPAHDACLSWLKSEYLR